MRRIFQTVALAVPIDPIFKISIAKTAIHHVMRQHHASPLAALGRREWFPHALLATLCLAMLLTGTLLPAPQPGQDHLSVAGMPLPPLCMWKNSTGIPCPGCGLTRSWVTTLNGEWRRGFAFHRLGWLTLVYVAIQGLRHLAWFFRPTGRKSLKRWGTWLDKSLIGIGILLLINWLISVIQQWSQGFRT